ncbi:hypothetical protein [Sphingomonas sp. PB4P5]|uniref:hypothetical protein n=1 Tax=Parasphingomonas puruogangriensis TaxID=3096155 RepID=UPI002FCAF09D
MQLQNMMDTTEGRIVADAARIERATGGMVKTTAAIASIQSYANAATRAERDVQREKATTEKSIEGLIRQIDRETAAVGRTRDEQRAARIEELAVTAARQGNTDAADRLLASTRQLRAAQESLAQDRFAAEARAAAEAVRERERAEIAVIEQMRERSRLEEALARTNGTDRPRATSAGATYSALAARAAEDEARANNAAAASADRLAREHAELVAMVRGSQAAMEADAAAAERLRMATDPLYAATSRLNAEIAESTRLYLNGATAPAEYARQQDVLTGRLRAVVQQQDTVNRSTGSLAPPARLAGHHMQNLAFQFQDLTVQMVAAAGSSAPFKMAMMAMMQQGMQIQGIMSQAGIGIRGVGAAFGTMSKAILLATVTNPILMGIAAAITVVAGAIKLLQVAANDGDPMKKYVASLGLTKAEIRNLDNVTVTYGDTAKAVFQVAGAAIWSVIGKSVTDVWKVMKDWAAWIGSGAKDAINLLIAAHVAGYNVIRLSWAQFPAIMGDAFYSAVNASIGAINALVKKSVEGLNYFAAQANKILPAGLQIPTLSAPQIAAVNNKYAGEAAKLGKTFKGEFEKAAKVDYVAKGGSAIADQAEKNARERLRKQAEEKGYLDPEKAKTDKHAESLAREAAAIEAQIRNLYALADAYGVSGAAALIAEARVKAESAAIKKRADIEEMVARQVRLSIAERVKAAAQGSAAMRDQAAMQERVNAEVAAGTVPAERAAELIRDRMADLPLLAAIEAARIVKDVKGGEAAEAALDGQRAARDRLTDAERAGQLQAAQQQGTNRLAELQEELRLVGATNVERARALAILQATQQAEGSNWSGPDASAWIAQQGEIAATAEILSTAQRNYNDALSFTADKWDLIARNVQNAAGGMADAFGVTGRAIGDMAAIYANYQADRAKLDLEHKQQVKAAGKDQAAIDRANVKFALASANSQVGAFGDMASAAKGFFNEKSKGYQAMLAAEQVFRAFEFAMSVRSMAQDIIETVSSVANSGARATAAGAEGVATQSKLPFPYNIAAMAATAAALIAAGIAVMGGGGGGKNTLPQSNQGTGTVLGDSSAKSDSIKNAIDALADVDTLTNTYARNMAASLRSIDNQIGGLASLVVRAGNINASSGVTEGFKMNGIGSVLSKIPLIGGILGGLFGSKTTVIGSGLYGGPQSVGSIVNGGFDASYYSDIEKKKKFLGITTGTKYSTQYTNADAGLENQFTLILRQFNDAILAAAGPLGLATGEVQTRLNNFIVDIGKIDLQGLSGTEIQEKLTAIFGAAADGMASAAFPGIERFQKVGEGLFETLVRVASTVEAVGASLDLLGNSAQGMSIDVKMGLADQFDSVADLTSAAEAYFQAYYSAGEQAAAKTAQMAKVFDSLGFAMPTTLEAFRHLVEAQDLTTASGQAAYATLLQLAPAFADLTESMLGAKSAADILSEREDLNRQLLELQGNTAAIRALDLAQLDESNRALQEQIWALQDAQAAANAAKELAAAWGSVGDSITAEINRIRGLSGTDTGDNFASLMGQFNAATAAAQAGDMDAAKSLPGLSQALLAAAALAATSQQELDRIKALTLASLEATNAAVAELAGAGVASTAAMLDAAAAASAAANPPPAANDDTTASELKTLREELAAMRAENYAGHAATASAAGRTARVLEDVTFESGGQAITVSSAA